MMANATPMMSSQVVSQDSSSTLSSKLSNVEFFLRLGYSWFFEHNVIIILLGYNANTNLSVKCIQYSWNWLDNNASTHDEYSAPVEPLELLLQDRNWEKGAENNRCYFEHGEKPCIFHEYKTNKACNSGNNVYEGNLQEKTIRRWYLLSINTNSEMKSEKHSHHVDNPQIYMTIALYFIIIVCSFVQKLQEQERHKAQCLSNHLH